MNYYKCLRNAERIIRTVFYVATQPDSMLCYNYRIRTHQLNIYATTKAFSVINIFIKRPHKLCWQ